jgi:hypothetical protein
MVANYVLTAMNDALGLKAPLYDLEQILPTDPYVVVPEKSSRSRYLLHEMRRSGGYTLPETQGVWVKTLQNRNGFHAPQTAKARRV